MKTTSIIFRRIKINKGVVKEHTRANKIFGITLCKDRRIIASRLSGTFLGLLLSGERRGRLSFRRRYLANSFQSNVQAGFMLAKGQKLKAWRNSKEKGEGKDRERKERERKKTEQDDEDNEGMVEEEGRYGHQRKIKKRSKDLRQNRSSSFARLRKLNFHLAARDRAPRLLAPRTWASRDEVSARPGERPQLRRRLSTRATSEAAFVCARDARDIPN